MANTKYLGEAGLNKVLQIIVDTAETKVDKVTGKQLSTEDFTTALKTKLNSLNNYNDSALAGRVTALETNLNTLLTSNPDEAINNFNEIIAFLASIEDSKTLSSLLQDLRSYVNSQTLSVKTTVDNYKINGKKISESPTLTKSDVGLPNVDNTSDSNKPLSTAMVTALADKLDTSSSYTAVEVETMYNNINK